MEEERLARKKEKISPDHPKILESIAGRTIEERILLRPRVVDPRERASLAVSWVRAWLDAEGWAVAITVVQLGQLGSASIFGMERIVAGSPWVFAFVRHLGLD